MVAVVTLASCSDEDENAGKGDGGKGKPAYIGVTITLPAPLGTRAENTAADIAGEKAVTTIGVYIVDANTAQFDYTILSVVADFTSSVDANNQDIYTAVTAIPTITGLKRVFVVANPTVALQTKLSNVRGTAVNAAAFGLLENAFLTEDSTSSLTSMVMSGAYTATAGILDMTKAVDETTALFNPIDITISRNLSKAVVQYESAKPNVIGGITTLTWTLINKAKDSYFLPQSAGTLFRDVPSEAETNTTHIYWMNFSGMTGADYIPVLAYGSGDAKMATYVQSKYMFENIPIDFYEGNTTAARIRGVFTPTTIYNDVSAGVPVVATEFTTGTDFYLSRVDGSYWTLAGRDAAIAAGYNGHTVNSDFSQYAGGVGYYTIWVNDGSGNKGVNRNSYYLMQISEVRGPGAPVEPASPIVSVGNDTNLAVKITVLNWDFKKSVQSIQ